jgi:phage protein D
MAPTEDTGAPSSDLYGAHPIFTVDGQAQPSLQDALLSLEVSDDLLGMARLEARFENWGRPPGGGDMDFMFFDGGVLSFGKRLEVDLGPEGASRTVFSGRITAIGARFGSALVPEISVRAEDALQFLRMTRRTRTWENVTDAQVAQQLAQAHNLQAEADAPGPTHKVLVQLAQTDLAFLRERAQAIDAQLWMDGDRLMFKARSATIGQELTLTLGQALTRFEVVADLAHQITEARGHGYDVQAKQDPDQSASASSLLESEAHGARTGASIFQQAFGARVEHLLDRASSTNDEARALAEAAAKARGRAFVHCRGETDGTAAMRVGVRVRVGGVGPVFSGTYVATQVTHHYDRGRGFRTTFEAERPAVGEER